MQRENLSHFTYANQVALIRGGGEFFQLLISLINEAEKSIYFQIYIFDDDDTGREVANALMAAARRNVHVHLLVDGYASQGLSGSFIQELKDSGIHFRWFKSFFKNKRFHLGRRLHHKVIVIDSVKSLVCGLNVSDRYNDTPESVAWLDWALYTQGAASVRLEQVCKKRMKDYSPSVANGGEGLEKGARCAVRICVNDWVARRSEVTRSYLEMMNSATSSVTIMSPYFMPGYQFRRTLKKAVKRGIKFQVILAGVSDIFVAKYAERYMYDWLLNLNVDIFEYQTNVLHGKMVVCDRQSVSVGSYNVNNLSAYASIELNLEIKNEAFAADVENRLSAIIKNECRQITRKVHASKTNYLQRMLRALAYNFLRLMLFVFAFKQRE
jgi:cardiolipin synthase A/B